MSTKPKVITLARVGRPHGVRGDLHVNQAGEHLRHFSGKSVIICTAPVLSGVLHEYNIKREAELSLVDPGPGETARIHFKDIDSREAAAGLTNFLICAPLDQMRELARAGRKDIHPPLTDLWYFEWIGLTVRDAESGTPIATISDVEDMGLNTLVALEPAANQNLLASKVLIPLDYPHWQNVDLEKSQIDLSEWRIFLE